MGEEFSESSWVVLGSQDFRIDRLGLHSSEGLTGAGGSSPQLPPAERLVLAVGGKCQVPPFATGLLEHP